MKIRNDSKRTYFFNGGYVAPGCAVDILDKAVADALIKGYPGELTCLDNIEAVVIPAVEKQPEETKEEVVETKKTKSKKKK